MAIQLYNTLTRKKEVFHPLHAGHVGMYSCGPTVYDYAHIGNLRSFIFVDQLKRYLKYKGLKVKHVMNLTDVDDKTIRGSQKAGIPLKQYTERYASLFFEDLKILNIDPADIFPKATEHIPQMMDLIEHLKAKGHTYEADGSVYYKISTFKDYGKLAHIDQKNLKAGASGRVEADEYTKESVHDFVLWKGHVPDDGPVFWNTSFGKGRPGWHIECSAMSRTYLGDTFDIHTGGVDLVFPHHQNEIAQSEGATGHQFVRYWVHNEHLLVDGKKMSKSLGNFYTLRDLVAKGYRPKAIRYLLLSSHYRTQLNFTEQSLKHAQNTVDSLLDFMHRLMTWRSTAEDNQNVGKFIAIAKNNFEVKMDDDLNISEALAAIFELVKEVNRLMQDNKLSVNDAGDVYDAMMGFDKVLGILQMEVESLDSEVEELVQRREQARKEKDFALADKIRDELKEKGILLEDGKAGVRWKRA